MSRAWDSYGSLNLRQLRLASSRWRTVFGRMRLGGGITAIRIRQIGGQITESARLWQGIMATMTTDAYPEMGCPKQSRIFGGAS